MKIKLTNKNLQYYRLRISEPSQSMLDALKNYWEENNIDTNVYGEWDKVSVEIEDNNIPLYTPRLIYYFDDYTTIPYEFASEELNIINNYLDKNFDRYPDNYVLGLGDAEYEELVDTIDKRHNVDLAVALNIALGIVEIEEFTVEVQKVTKEDYKLFKDNITEDEVGKSAFFFGRYARSKSWWY